MSKDNVTEFERAARDLVDALMAGDNLPALDPMQYETTVSTIASALTSHARPAAGEKDDLLYEAWGVIANASGGNWDLERPEWKEAAERWRDKWHKTLPSTPAAAQAERGEVADGRA